jgi:hypothetical protein
METDDSRRSYRTEDNRADRFPFPWQQKPIQVWMWLECALQTFMKTSWKLGPQYGGVEVVKTLRCEAWWEVIRSLWVYPQKELMSITGASLVPLRLDCYKKMRKSNTWIPLASGLVMFSFFLHRKQGLTLGSKQ